DKPAAQPIVGLSGEPKQAVPVGGHPSAARLPFAKPEPTPLGRGVGTWRRRAAWSCKGILLRLFLFLPAPTWLPPFLLPSPFFGVACVTVRSGVAQSSRTAANRSNGRSVSSSERNASCFRGDASSFSDPFCGDAGCPRTTSTPAELSAAVGGGDLGVGKIG